MTEAEKFVPIRKLAESGFLTESRLRKMHKQGKPPGIWCGKKFLVNVPLLNEELDREGKKQLNGGERNEWCGAISDYGNGEGRCRQVRHL